MLRTSQHTSFLVNAIRELDGGINNHARWLAGFHQAMICGTPPDASITATDGHRLSAFGRWFYDRRNPAEWTEWQEDVEQIDSLNVAMHQHARTLAAQRREGQTIDTVSYAAFTELAMRFRLALRALEAKVSDSVCLIDQLTGVWNRSSMQQKLSEEYSRMSRSGQQSCLCMMDLDHFKAINDQYGHVAGDTVLQSTTEIVKRRLRPYDSIFRYGGEEFLFCLPDIAVDSATAAMDRIRADIEANVIALNDGTDVRVTASFGVTPFLRELSLEENIESADRALFCAKAEGRNRVCRWD